MPKCDFCNKNKIIVLKCLCEKHFCMKHNLPIQHNCTHSSDIIKDKFMQEATGKFSKLEKI